MYSPFMRLPDCIFCLLDNSDSLMLAVPYLNAFRDVLFLFFRQFPVRKFVIATAFPA